MTEGIKAIADYYGLEHQIEKTIEELTELSLVLLHYKRMKKDGVWQMFIENFAEEMADVEIMTEQLKYLVKECLHTPIDADINIAKEKKIARQLRRMKEEIRNEFI